MNKLLLLFLSCLPGALLVLAGPALATPDAPAGPAAEYKLTTGWTRLSDHTQGWDLNLRRSTDAGNTWIGYFRQDSQAAAQWRAGWDASYGTDVRFSPSVQLASGGFAGASLMLEAGTPWFVGAGLGRTNLKPYWNLNFDPNDAWTLSAGHRSADNQLLQVQLVRDNRQNPDQRHLHFLYRQPMADGERLTVDVLNKAGLVNGAPIQRWGLSLTWDWPRWSARVAWDPKTNFTPENALRLSIGRRF